MQQMVSSRRSATAGCSSPGACCSKYCRLAATVLGRQRASSSESAEPDPEGEGGSERGASQGKEWSLQADPGQKLGPQAAK